MEPPRYGWAHPDGTFYAPTTKLIVAEFFHRLNLRTTRKNWLPFYSWLTTSILAVPLIVFFARYFSWKLFAVGFVYAMVILGTHGTVYLHRYATHRAFRFRSSVWRFFAKNLVIKIVPEEVYVVSHHIHHLHCEQPGDPYNVHGGFLYCFLADVNHQPIARNLSERQYERLTKLLNHCGMRLNDYAQYRKWGSLCHPGYTVLAYSLNWAFWYAAFWSLGGHALATVIFGSVCVWAVGVRTFNYAGHGSGKDRRTSHDFNRRDLSINQLWPGFISGEWHNNHHLYPNGARSGFLPYQLDLAWLFIRALDAVGGVSSYRDYKAAFLRDHYAPYDAAKAR